MRDSEYKARLNGAQRDLAQQEADAVIERIQQEARITAARDRADFQITLDRLEMRAEIERRSPIAIAPITAEQDREHPPSTPEGLDVIQTPSRHREPAVTSAITDREQPSIGDLAREQVAITPDNAIAIGTICSLRPDAHRPSVAAAVRRARQQLDSRGGYR
jgi:hypothetical protein